MARKRNEFPLTGADAFATNLKQRRQAALGLEQDLLTSVPLLYGSPGFHEDDEGDPGIALARIHREEMVRRNGGGIPNASSERSDVALPYEGLVMVIAVMAYLFFAFGNS